MQRHALLMYTSCGWFFEELSRPEGTQILRYAARALELAGAVTGIHLETAFVNLLALAPSNVEFFGHGAAVFHHLVRSAQISLEQVAAHYAIGSLFTPYNRDQQVYCYGARQVDFQLQRMGSLTLAVGQLKLVSEITQESSHLVFAVLHLSGWDFHCCIQPFAGKRTYSDLKEELFNLLKLGSAAQMILTMQQHFGDQSFGLQDLFAEERHRIMRLLSQETLTRLDQLYTQVYRDNYGVLMAFHRDELSVPQELQVAAEVALSQRSMLALRSLEQDDSSDTNHLAELETIAAEANHLHCSLNIPDAKATLERLILRSLWHLLYSFDSSTATVALERIDRLMRLSNQMHLGASIARAQELYFQRFHAWIVPNCQHYLGQKGQAIAPALKLNDLKLLLNLGQLLAIDVASWTTRLAEDK
jgi:alpha-amylase/alpha-mannosidase (GH57 family)